MSDQSQSNITLENNQNDLSPEAKKNKEFKLYLETYTFKIIFFINIASIVLVANYFCMYLFALQDILAVHLRSTFFVFLPLSLSIILQPMLKDFRRSLNKRGMYILTGFSLFAVLLLARLFLF